MESIIKKYAVVGYDKDGDVYETLWETDNLNNAIIQACIFYEQHKQKELRRISTNEPFDWIEVIDINDESVSFWKSCN